MTAVRVQGAGRGMNQEDRPRLAFVRAWQKQNPEQMP
jgi:hypothetical protein